MQGPCEVIPPRTMKRPEEIRPASGKLGILLPGMGAVGTTFIAGCMLARKGIAKPFGSLTQMGPIRIGKRTDGQSPRIKDFLPPAPPDDIVLGRWHLFHDTALDAARTAASLANAHPHAIAAATAAVTPSSSALLS